MKKYRIIQNLSGNYEIQALHKSWFGFGKPYWETCGSPDWAAVYGTLDAAERQIKALRGSDYWEGRVIMTEEIK